VAYHEQAEVAYLHVVAQREARGVEAELQEEQLGEVEEQERCRRRSPWRDDTQASNRGK
jgi:hypothetical protein